MDIISNIKIKDIANKIIVTLLGELVRYYSLNTFSAHIHVMG